jgi:hypothetical protein
VSQVKPISQDYLVNKPNALKVFVIPQNLLFSASSAEKCEFMGNPVWFLDTQKAFVGFLRIALPISDGVLRFARDAIMKTDQMVATVVL